MPKFPTFPTLYDECKTVCISDLKRWGYLISEQYNRGVITWSRNGNKTGSISIVVNTYSENSFIILDYKINDNPIKYTIPLVTIPSNLGRGLIWYFLCPVTMKRCRKLYLVNGYFYQRSAFRGCMYEKQTYSYKTLKLYKFYGRLFNAEKAFEQIYSKYFKKQYNGKPTKRYSKLLKKVKIERRILEKHYLLL